MSIVFQRRQGIRFIFGKIRNHVQEVLHSLQLHNYTRQSVDQIFTKILLDFDPAQPGTGYSTISKAVQTRIKPLPTKVTMICAPERLMVPIERGVHQDQHHEVLILFAADTTP